MTLKKTILITGSTDGIGFEAAKTLIAQGHRVLLHGRNPEKLAAKIEKTTMRLTSNNLEVCLLPISHRFH